MTWDGGDESRITALIAERDRLRNELVGIRFDAECAAEGYAEDNDEVAQVFARIANRAALAGSASDSKEAAQ